MLDFLAFFTRLLRLYHPAIPLIVANLRSAGTRQLVDLASGGGGPLASIWTEIVRERSGTRILLTDLFPNRKAYEQLANYSQGVVTGDPVPQDAVSGLRPVQRPAVYTMFSATHHFPPRMLRELMQRALHDSETMLLLDGGGSRLLMALGVLLQMPVFLLVTPFLRPFRWSRIVLTYIVPVIPFCTVWDGLVSVARLYSLKELEVLASSLPCKGYRWQAGSIRHPLGVRINFLAGGPDERPV